MALETAFFLAQELLKLNAFVLLGVVLVFAYAAFRIFALLLRILVTGVAFGTFPVIANIAGIPVPLTLQSILWSAFAGILIYFIYSGIGFAFRLINLVFGPLKRGFTAKPKRAVVREVREVRKEERKAA